MAEKTSPPKTPADKTADKAADKAWQPPKTSRPAKVEVGTPEGTPAGERIAKVLSRAGIASRREAERLIEIGEVAVNGTVITSPALNVTDRDKITVGGKPVKAAEPARLWLYYKPEGLVNAAKFHHRVPGAGCDH